MNYIDKDGNFIYDTKTDKYLNNSYNTGFETFDCIQKEKKFYNFLNF